ncbi:MAG: hypothetical protein R3B40_05315 [Polyangiales bacterium]|nr:hypothetical protein [Myxococcales bacterium]MCB9660801.1 hypothetical protein [Sandaracinaceae bacterium]
MSNATDDTKSDPGSQADELTEMWDASALDAATAELEAQAAARPATAPVRRDEPSVQVNIAAAPSAPRKVRKKKKGLAAMGLPVQLALAVLVAVVTFGLVKLLLTH